MIIQVFVPLALKEIYFHYIKSVPIEDFVKLLRNLGYKPLGIENRFGIPNFCPQIRVSTTFVRETSLKFLSIIQN